MATVWLSHNQTACAASDHIVSSSKGGTDCRVYSNEKPGIIREQINQSKRLSRPRYPRRPSVEVKDETVYFQHGMGSQPDLEIYGHEPYRPSCHMISLGGKPIEYIIACSLFKSMPSGSC